MKTSAEGEGSSKAERERAAPRQSVPTPGIAVAADPACRLPGPVQRCGVVTGGAVAQRRVAVAMVSALRRQGKSPTFAVVVLWSVRAESRFCHPSVGNGELDVVELLITRIMYMNPGAVVAAISYLASETRERQSFVASFIPRAARM